MLQEKVNSSAKILIVSFDLYMHIQNHLKDLDKVFSRSDKKCQMLLLQDSESAKVGVGGKE